MNRIKNFIENKNITLKLLPSLLIIFLATLITFTFVIKINSEFLQAFLSFMQENVVLALLNYLPILLFALILFFATNNAVQTSAVTFSLFCLLAFINSEKINLRQDPLFPTDVALFTELIGIGKNFTPKTIIFYLGLIVTFIFIVILGSLLFKTTKINPRIRIYGIVITIIIGIFSNFSLYSNKDLYQFFPVEGNAYFEVNQYGSKGFIYSFLHNFNALKVKAPNNYSKNYYSIEENSFNASEYSENKLPHIIMIMGEAFTDLSNNSNLDFSNYTDPLENWKNLLEDENTISGHIVVPNFGGGTSDTEFDVLTGYPTRYINNPTNSYNLIRKNTDSIPWQLKKLGYTNLAIHPGYSWFYNRENVFKYLGFDNFIHLSSFQGEEKYLGGYIADKYLTDSIIENFENHINSNDNPMLQFAVTIQNHGPYDEKYPDTQKMFDTDIPLTKKEKSILNNYFAGVQYSDVEIERLISYFSQTDEPVIFVYFGDHLPGFSNGMEFFDILDYNIDSNGTIEEVLNLYKTPFAIWQNDSAKGIYNMAENKDNLKLSDTNLISANYLGGLVLEAIGLNGISPFLEFSNYLRKEIPVTTNSNFLTAEDGYTNTLDSGLENKVNVLKGWTYFKMFDEQ